MNPAFMNLTPLFIQRFKSAENYTDCARSIGSSQAAKPWRQTLAAFLIVIGCQTLTACGGAGGVAVPAQAPARAVNTAEEFEVTIDTRDETSASVLAGNYEYLYLNALISLDEDDSLVSFEWKQKAEDGVPAVTLYKSGEASVYFSSWDLKNEGEVIFEGEGLSAKGKVPFVRFSPKRSVSETKRTVPTPRVSLADNPRITAGETFTLFALVMDDVTRTETQADGSIAIVTSVEEISLDASRFSWEITEGRGDIALENNGKTVEIPTLSSDGGTSLRIKVTVTLDDGSRRSDSTRLEIRTLEDARLIEGTTAE